MKYTRIAFCLSLLVPCWSHGADSITPFNLTKRRPSKAEQQSALAAKLKSERSKTQKYVDLSAFSDSFVVKPSEKSEKFSVTEPDVEGHVFPIISKPSYQVSSKKFDDDFQDTSAPSIDSSIIKEKTPYTSPSASTIQQDTVITIPDAQEPQLLNIQTTSLHDTIDLQNTDEPQAMSQFSTEQNIPVFSLHQFSPQNSVSKELSNEYPQGLPLWAKDTDSSDAARTEITQNYDFSSSTFQVTDQAPYQYIDSSSREERVNRMYPNPHRYATPYSGKTYTTSDDTTPFEVDIDVTTTLPELVKPKTEELKLFVSKISTMKPLHHEHAAPLAFKMHKNGTSSEILISENPNVNYSILIKQADIFDEEFDLPVIKEPLPTISFQKIDGSTSTSRFGNDANIIDLSDLHLHAEQKEYLIQSIDMLNGITKKSKIPHIAEALQSIPLKEALGKIRKATEFYKDSLFKKRIVISDKEKGYSCDRLAELQQRMPQESISAHHERKHRLELARRKIAYNLAMNKAIERYVTDREELITNPHIAIAATYKEDQRSWTSTLGSLVPFKK